MRKRNKVILAVLALFVAGLVIAGSLIGMEVSAKVGDRIIWAESAHVLSKASLTMDSTGTVVVHLGDKQITVTQDAVLLPDGAALVVPAPCKRIALSETRHGVRVRFDGVAVN